MHVLSTCMITRDSHATINCTLPWSLVITRCAGQKCSSGSRNTEHEGNRSLRSFNDKALRFTSSSRHEASRAHHKNETSIIGRYEVKKNRCVHQQASHCRVLYTPSPQSESHQKRPVVNPSKDAIFPIPVPNSQNVPKHPVSAGYLMS